MLWDAGPEFVAARHLPLLADHSAGRRTLVDLGCGNGTQTWYLASGYPRVVGVDISQAAVERARSGPPVRGAAGAADPGGEPLDCGAGHIGWGAHGVRGRRVPEQYRPSAQRETAAELWTPPSVPEFRQLDAADPEQVRQLQAELGDSDVYLRGVLHQSDPGDRARIAESVAVLVGEWGRALVVEPGQEAKATLLSLVERSGTSPASIAMLFRHGLAPMEMADGAMPALFGGVGLEVLASGTQPLALTVRAADGSPTALRSNWLVVGRNG